MERKDINTNNSNENLSVSIQSSKSEDDDGIVVTIYFNGTCSSIEDATPREMYPDGETISTTREKTIGAAYGFDGPGSGSKLHKEYSNATQIGLGWGIEKNIATVINDLAKLRNEQKIKRVNIAGWSRGAAAGISCAAQMAQHPKLKDLPVNLFAIDPVPGFSNVDQHNTTIHNNVKNAVLVYAQNERSAGFGAVVPIPASNNHESKIKYIGMPGHHATLVGNPYWRNGTHFSGKKDINLPEPGKIVRWMLHQFLLQYGSGIKDPVKLTRQQLLDLFENIFSKKTDFISVQDESYTTTQKHGTERKVAHGRSWFNNYLNKAIPMYDKTDVVNELHQFILDHTNDPVDLNKFFSDVIPLEKNWTDFETNQPIPDIDIADDSDKNINIEKALTNSISHGSDNKREVSPPKQNDPQEGHEDLRKQLDQLKNEKQKLQKQFEILQNELSSMKTEHSVGLYHKEEILKKLSQQLNKNDDKIALFEDELKTKEATINNFSSKLKEEKKNNAALTQQLEKLQAEKSELENKLKIQSESTERNKLELKNEIDIFNQFIQMGYILQSNRGIFHRHGTAGKKNAKDMLENIRKWHNLNSQATIQEFSNQLKLIMTDKLNGNYYPHSLKTYVLAFYHYLQDKMNNKESSPQKYFAKFEEMDSDQIKLHYYKVIGKKLDDDDFGIHKYPHLDRF